VVGSGNREANATPGTVAIGSTGAKLILFLHTRFVLWGPQVVDTRVEPFPSPAVTLQGAEISCSHGAELGDCSHLGRRVAHFERGGNCCLHLQGSPVDG
jgi:hypothetical protein